ncbi:MAG: ABC transporter ATP-binding protein [Deltaproteobacteria bacterium]|nr:ABC transporter ATP-binding protein [Deltaproteobacteria bacterium]
MNDSAAAHDDTILALDGLAKTFRVGFWGRPVPALRGVSLTMRRGESLGYLGPNGSGKTTSIKCIVGLIQASAGKVSLFGGDPGEAQRRARVGYLPESPYFYDYLTPVEVLEYVGKLYGMGARDRAQRSKMLLGQVGLEHAARRPLRGFSKGMLQRVGIAQSLLADPDLLIWDEPLSGLDPMGRKEVRDLMASLRADGKSLFFSSHVLSDIETLCDAVCILDRGEAVAQGRLSELLRSEELESEALVDLPSSDGRAAVLANLADLPGANLTDLPSGIRLLLPTAQVPELMRLLLEAGGTIRELSQRRDSLEELFLRKAVRRGEGAA